MKRWSGWLMTIALVAMLACGSTAGADSTKELCVVCAVTKGETETESVHATRTYEGTTYAFCSDDCAKAFDADPAAYVPPTFPRPAPAFKVTGLDGKAISADSLRGRVVLLDFWATWCAPCRKTMPELDALHARHKAKGLTVLGVATDEGSAKSVRSKVQKFVTLKKLTYPIALDRVKDPAWQAYRVKAVPAAYLIDRKGRIVAQWLGAPANPSEMEERIVAALGEID